MCKKCSKMMKHYVTDIQKHSPQVQHIFNPIQYAIDNVYPVHSGGLCNHVSHNATSISPPLYMPDRTLNINDYKNTTVGFQSLIPLPPNTPTQNPHVI